jgi:hypothetical protein
MTEQGPVSDAQQADWVGTAEVQRILGLSRSTVMRLAKIGRIKGDLVDGQRRFDRAYVESLRGTLGTSGGDEESGDDPSPLRTMNEWNRVLLQEHRQMFSATLERADRVLELLAAENEHMRERHLELITTVEAALSLKSERETEQIKVAASIEQRQVGLEMVGRIVGRVVQQIKSSGDAAQLVQGLDAESWRFVSQLEMSETQRRALFDLRGEQFPGNDRPEQQEQEK